MGGTKFAMAIARVSRAEKLIERSPNLTPEGKSWLMKVMDPFHDKPFPMNVGWPDGGSGTSVNYCVKESGSVSSPFTVGGALQPFDMHVICWPWTNDVRMNDTTDCLNNVFSRQDWTNGVPIGGIQVFGTRPGIPLDLTDRVNCPQMAQITLPLQYSSGVGRLVSLGFEVTNVTPELYKSGTCTVWRMNQPRREQWTGMRDATAGGVPKFWGSTTNTYIREPPTSLAQAMLLPGTRQWEAKEGSYTVVNFNKIENDFREPSYIEPVIVHNNEDGEIQEAPSVNDFNVMVCDAINNDFDYPSAYSLRMHDINQSGVLYTGNHAESKYTITAIFYYESVPGIIAGIPLQLSVPLAPYDPVALAAYGAASDLMPPGVKKGENGLGDFFLDVAQGLLSQIPVVGPALNTAITGARTPAKQAVYNIATPNPTVPVGKPVSTRVSTTGVRLRSLPPPASKKVVVVEKKPKPKQIPPKKSVAGQKLKSESTATLQKKGFTKAQAKVIHTR